MTTTARRLTANDLRLIDVAGLNALKIERELVTEARAHGTLAGRLTNPAIEANAIVSRYLNATDEELAAAQATRDRIRRSLGI